MEPLSGDSSLQEAASSASALFALNSSIVLARRLMEIGALATNCYGQLQTAENVDRSAATLLSIAETVRRLNGCTGSCKPARTPFVRARLYRSAQRGGARRR